MSNADDDLVRAHRLVLLERLAAAGLTYGLYVSLDYGGVYLEGELDARHLRIIADALDQLRAARNRQAKP